MTSPLPAQAKAFARALARWFKAAGRDYPWRRTADPYAVLVSEIMLQQTQLATVLDRGYYARWMKRFPDFSSLAAARESEVLKAWEGLGYYRRARFLHRLAQTVLGEHDGVFPRDLAAIRKLPGIGDYTAGAVASFAFDGKEPLVDGNVARVLARLFADATPVDSTAGKRILWQRAARLVSQSSGGRIHNSALMELGQTICRPAQPLCPACPVRQFCAATNPASLPVKSKRATVTELTERVYFLRTEAGVLLQQETGARRTGLWKLPALQKREKLPPLLHESTYTITRYRVTLHVHAAPGGRRGAPAADHAMVPIADLPELPMPSPFRRALEAVLGEANLNEESLHHAASRRRACSSRRCDPPRRTDWP